MRLRIESQRRLISLFRSLVSDQMDGMVGQHRNEQVRADTGVRAMPDLGAGRARTSIAGTCFQGQSIASTCGESFLHPNRCGWF